MGVVVIGEICRDLVLQVTEHPGPDASAAVLERREMLGGKGANQAVGLAQLGETVELIGVAGEDEVGAECLEQLAADGVGIRGVARRGSTALMVTTVDGSDDRRLFEQRPATALVTEADVVDALAGVSATDTVSIQLQQPAAPALAAVRAAKRVGATVVADGVVEGRSRDELLPGVDVLRADGKEAAILGGEPIEEVEKAATLGRQLVAEGPGLVVLAVPGVGDLLVWSQGDHLLPLADVSVVDRTGAGDAFVAGLVHGMRQGGGAVDIGRLATAAAAATVQRLGGRPDLTGLCS